MEYKVESSLWNFQAWSGGKDTLDTLKEKGDVDEVEEYLDMIFMETDMTDTDINDTLWFERDAIAEHLGYKDWEAYEEGWSLEDLKEAEDWFEELDLGEMEEVSGLKRDNYRDPDAMLDEEEFIDAVEEWWNNLDEEKKVDIYNENN